MKQYFFNYLAIASTLFAALCLTGGGCADSVRIGPASLSSLTISPAGDLLPVFSSSTTSYTATVPTDVNSVIVEASPDEATASITINGMETPAGAKQSVALLPLGMETSIDVVVTSSDGQSTTYTIAITKLASREVSLALLIVSGGPLQPAFDPSIANYTVKVPSNVETVTLSATKADRDAVLSGVVAVDPGSTTAETAIGLSQPGTISYASVTVTAPNGSFRIYTIAINRLLPDGSPPPPTGPPSMVSTLSGLSVSSATLSPQFSPATTTYSGTYNTCFPGIQTLTATKSDPNAVMSMPGKTVPAGVASGAISIIAGTTVTIVVKAEDQVHKTTYSVSVSPRFCR